MVRLTPKTAYEKKAFCIPTTGKQKAFSFT